MRNFFYISIILLCDVALAQSISVVKTNKKNLILKYTGDNPYIFDVGDVLVLENDNGKCLVEVKKSKSSFAVASSQQCSFNINIGDEARFLDADRAVISKDENKSEDKDTREDVDKDVDKSVVGNDASSEVKKFRFNIGMSYMRSPTIDYESIRVERLGLDVGNDDEEFKDLKGISFEMSLLIKSFYISYGSDIFFKSNSKEYGNSTTIKPHHLYINVGRIAPFQLSSWKGQLNVFIGGGRSFLEFEDDLLVNTVSMGTFLHFGAGIIYNNLFFDLVFRKEEGEISGSINDKSPNELVGFILKSDYSYSDLIFRVGVAF